MTSMFLTFDTLLFACDSNGSSVSSKSEQTELWWISGVHYSKIQFLTGSFEQI